MNTGKLDLLAEQAEVHASQSSPLLTPVISSAEDPQTETSAKLDNEIQALMTASLTSLPEPTATAATTTAPTIPPTTITSQLYPTENFPATTTVTTRKSSTTTPPNNTTAATSNSSSDEDEATSAAAHSSNNNSNAFNDVINSTVNDDDNDDVETILTNNPSKRTSHDLISCGRDLLHLLESVKYLDIASISFDSAHSQYQGVLSGVQKRLDELEAAHFLDPRELLAMERLRVLALKIAELLRVSRAERALGSAGGLGEDGAPVGVVITAYPDSAVLKQTTKYKNKPLRFVLKVVHAQGRRFEVVSAEARHELVLCSQPPGHGGLSRSASGVMPGSEGLMAIATMESVAGQDQDGESAGALQSPSLKRRKTEVIDESTLKDIVKPTMISKAATTTSSQEVSLKALRRSNSLGLSPSTSTATTTSTTTSGSCQLDDLRSKPSKTAVAITTTHSLSADTYEITCRATSGTRKTPVSIHFVLTLRDLSPGGRTYQVTTRPSPSYFTIITNECQYDGGNYELLRALFFRNEAAVPWPLFANRLQRNIITITKQTLRDTQRCLSRHELAYIYARFFEPLSLSLNIPGASQAQAAPTVSCAAFETFWLWYGKAVHQLKNSKNLHAMWSKGVFWGFASREDAERAVLAEGAPGVFVLRFSETNPGAFAACYSAAVEGEWEQKGKGGSQKGKGETQKGKDWEQKNSCGGGGGNHKGKDGCQKVKDEGKGLRVVAYHLLFPVNSVTQHHSLSDVVQDAAELETVLKVSFDDRVRVKSEDGSEAEDGSEVMRFVKMDKTSAFKEFYSNHKPTVNKNGYVIK